MYDNICELDKKLEKEKESLLNSYYESPHDIEKIQQHAIEVDEINVEYLNLKIYLEKERIAIIKKYENIINQSFKFEIRNQIRDEARTKNHYIGPREMEQFATNVYIYCCLLAYNVEETNIVQQLIYLNNKFYEEVTKQELLLQNIKPEIIISLEYTTYLKNKYIEIIKERINI